VIGRRFERYVAIGDSSTEGLDDPDGTGGFRGWANRLAEHVARVQGGLEYANLAVRGRRTRQVLDEQLAPALAMRPDLATIFAGTNDVVRRNFDLKAVGADLGCMQRALVSQGATVLTFTLPDLSSLMPLARLVTPGLSARVSALNGELRRVAAENRVVLVDLARHPVAADPRLWSDDRLHANALGHERIAAALAHALGLPGFGPAWQSQLPDPLQRTVAGLLRSELRWWRQHLVPWLWRHAQGRSSGDGRSAKRPRLEPMPADGTERLQNSF